MRYRVVRIVLASVCGLGSLPWLASPATAAAPTQAPPSPTATARAQEITATVRSVDASARRVDLLTGVGHALRIVRISVAEGCQIRVRAAAAGLRDVKAGDICWVQFRRIAGRNVAERIEVQGAAGRP